MRYEIKTKCDECDGQGQRQRQTAVDEFRNSNCYECNSTGFITLYETHDSESDALADYPHSLVRPVLSPISYARIHPALYPTSSRRIAP